MPRPSLLDALKTRPLLCDGAMGTQLIAAGLPPGAAGEAWNLDNFVAVEAIHRKYRQAGCDLVTTNTFGGTTFTLGRHGLEDKADAINRAAARLARNALGDGGWVLGDVGPFGDFLEPLGTFLPDQVQGMFLRQLHALCDAGADAVVVETMVDPNELTLAVEAAKAVSSWPVIATYAFGRAAGGEFRTMMGTTVHDAVRAAVAAGADVVGANCGTALSLDDYLKLARQLVQAAGNTPVILQPNGGAPRTAPDGKLHYDATPDQMAALVPQLLDAGVKIIGGCCGTTPDHLKAMSQALRAASNHD